MKVAIFSRYPREPDRPKGGVESVTVVLVRALAQLNDLDVHVITLERDEGDACLERDGRVTIHRLPGSGWPQMLDILVGPGRRRILTCVRELKADVLHTHETHGLALGNISLPHVFTVHGFDHANLAVDSAKHAWIRSRLWKHAERKGLATQKHIISITPYVRHTIESQTSAIIYDIDNPVDERFFRIPHRPEPGRILCVGWINERKNTLGSVEAFARIADWHREARLIVAGDTKREPMYFQRVKETIRRNGIGDRVELLGHISHVQLEQELSRASVLLLPSRQENAPMAIAEAMAASVPVIAANRCGMPHMVREGQTGFLIDPESPDQIADRLARLVSSASLCKQMAETGRRVAEERFHPRAVAEKTAAVYRAIWAEHFLQRAKSPVGVL